MAQARRCGTPFLRVILITCFISAHGARVAGGDLEEHSVNASTPKLEVADKFGRQGELLEQEVPVRKAQLSWQQQRVLAILLVLGLFTLAVTWLVASGIQTMVQTRSLRPKQAGGQSHLSIQVVVEARVELLRSLLDTAIQNSEDPNKVLVALFNEVMERIWECKESGTLDNEVEIVLETALESNEQCAGISERRQLWLDLVASVVQHAEASETKASLLTVLAKSIQQQIRALVKEGVIARKALLDLAASRETDGMLNRQLRFLLSEEAMGCQPGGCFGLR